MPYLYNYGGSGGGGGGDVTIQTTVQEITASGLSEDAGQVLVEGGDGGALLTGDGIRVAVDATLGGPEWRQASPDRLLSYDVAARRLDILGGIGAVIPLATPAADGLLSAADKAAIDAGLSGGEVAVTGASDYPSRAAVAGASVPAGVTALRTHGFAAPGDGGGGPYRRVASEPAHAGKIRSADGAWWELVAEGGAVNVLQFGAARLLSATDAAPTVDAYAAFADAIAFSALFERLSAELAGVAVIVPEGRYLLSQSLVVRRTLRLRGPAGPEATRLQFAPDTAGILLLSSRTTPAGDVFEEPDNPATFGSRVSVIEGLEIHGGGATANAAHPGIRLDNRAILRDCVVRFFPGHGIEVVGNAIAEGSNANQWRIDNVDAVSNGLSGFFFSGVDANAGTGTHLDASANGRWGIEDRSFLGNHFHGVHTQANGFATSGKNGGVTAVVHRGGRLWSLAAAANEAQAVATEPGTDAAVWLDAGAGGPSASTPEWQAGQAAGTYVHGGSVLTTDANCATIFSGLYTEIGQGVSQLAARSMAIGGLIGQVSGPGYAQLGGRVFGGAVEYASDASDPIPFTLRIGDGTGHALNIVPDGDPDGLQLSYTPVQGGVFAWQTRFDALTCQTFTLGFTTHAFGRSAPVGAGFTQFPQGAFHGFGEGARQFLFAADAQAGTAHGPGDVVLNNAATGPFGWIWLTENIPGVQAGTARALWQVPSLDGAVTLPGFADAALAALDPAPHAGTLVYQSDRGALGLSDGTAWRDPRAFPVRTLDGNATLAAADAFALLRVTASADVALTVPAGALAPGELVHILQTGTGQTTVVAGAGVIIHTRETRVLDGVSALAALVAIGTDEYLLAGDLEAAP
ncbi:MAG: hypothetical protein ACFBSD_10680 [Paracoccaceae bacterium]